MSRLHPIETTCSYCSKKFLAKRSDARFCGSPCRAQWSNIQKAKPAIVAEARKSFAEEQRLKFDSIRVPDEYKRLVEKLALLRGKDDAWIARKINAHKHRVIDDFEVGFSKSAIDDFAIEEVKDEFKSYDELYKKIGGLYKKIGVNGQRRDRR